MDLGVNLSNRGLTLFGVSVDIFIEGFLFIFDYKSFELIILFYFDGG